MNLDKAFENAARAEFAQHQERDVCLSCARASEDGGVLDELSDWSANEWNGRRPYMTVPRRTSPLAFSVGTFAL